MNRQVNRRVARSLLSVAVLAAALGVPAVSASSSASASSAPTSAQPRESARKAAARRAATATHGPIQSADKAETRLIGVYELFGRGKSSAALASAEKLVKDYPNFQLAQLVYADLLAARVAPARNLANGASATRMGAGPALAELQEESQRRLQSLRERPPAGTVPSQFLALSARTRYAVAVDASRSRLYLLQNTADKGMQVVADYYISVGRAGIGKLAEGDARTPLGVYHVTSNLDPKSLRDFYGAGALPINYPNPYDVRKGRTGSGIWLHGTPAQQYARAPQATDGCVVMSNTDLRELLRRVEVGTTPVVIASSLKWITPQQAKNDLGNFGDVLNAWREARTSSDPAQLQRFYAADVQPALPRGMTLVSTRPGTTNVPPAPVRPLVLKDVSFLNWKDNDDTMVVTFGEVREGEKTGRSRRQYWLRVGRDWKIFQEDLTS
ncbi:L,D-transpeptidase family protein [Variovorax ginsengisoli]|uniref:Lipoprotein-anchoring transpeptidase ErfK/SrfK n=1 Tax=Variovorax ginsengisoli TaxID=363844 RepID=A0ABT9SH22_9BURK|nr:L,D-transpeptidase [Variovorax ginsengisoli]MDP9902717.1 lipoprotein-anchoring transpeptidase ErfK/SrfK [Variovorax ginsengisoli]